MYEMINNLIDSIIQTSEFQNYQQAQKELYDNHTMALLSRYQDLMENYLRIKKYSHDVGQDDLKASLKEIQEEIKQNPDIQKYYQAYYQLNDMLEEVTEIVFQNISSDLKQDRWKI